MAREKSEVVHVRLSPKELAELDAIAERERASRSAVLRGGVDKLRGYGPRTHLVLFGDELLPVVKNLNAIGNNVNQIARALNRAAKSGEGVGDELVGEASETLAQVRKALDDFNYLLAARMNQITDEMRDAEFNREYDRQLREEQRRVAMVKACR